MVEKITDYVKPVKVNGFIAELKGIAPGDVFAENVPTRLNKDGLVRGLDGVKHAIQSAARENGFTARVIESTVITEPTEDEGGVTRLVFEAFDLQKSPERSEKPAEK